MRIQGKQYRTIWPNYQADKAVSVSIIDQTRLPHAFEVVTLTNLAEMVAAIKTMQVRGAPLIGASAAYGVALALLSKSEDSDLLSAIDSLKASRPTAVNLAWALARMRDCLMPVRPEQRAARAFEEAAKICDEDVVINQQIGIHGLHLIKEKIATFQQARPINILTHCNAGWLATVDNGTALAPIYAAHDAGLDVHVWVDETRPRNQGASLTAWELGAHGVPHTVICDNAGGHFMQHGEVDMAIVGADRVTASGDVCNKIGTYLKALAAYDNQVPFYVAVPSPTIDWDVKDGVKEIPIEHRSAEEVTHIQGISSDGKISTVLLTPVASNAKNPAFDVTPARLVGGIITQMGIFQPNKLSNQQ